MKPEDDRPADLPRVFRHIRTAADMGHPAAELGLGTMYEKGMGVPQRNMNALYYYSVSLQRGNKAAETYVDSLRARMKPEDVAGAEAMLAQPS